MDRAADPYRDTSVIDARAPRFNQAVVGLISVVAVTFGPWWLLAVLAAQLAVGLTLGRRYCLPCLAYFELVQPRFGEGPLEDARPPRFANLVGVVFLTAASIAFAAGWDAAGTALGAIVAALALLAAATGLCAGCEAYKLGYRLLGRTFVSCPLPPQPAPSSLAVEPVRVIARRRGALGECETRTQGARVLVARGRLGRRIAPPSAFRRHSGR